MFGRRSYTGLALSFVRRSLVRHREQRLVENVLAFIRRHDLVRTGEPLVVGVSGGPDSVCLLHLLMRLQNDLGTSLHVAHLNHMLRGEESDDDAEYVVRMAGDFGLSISVERRDVRCYRSKHHLSVEAAARRLRYQFFADVVDRVGADAVAVGHTADDQVETVLMRLIRGTGAKGLQSMQPAARWYGVGEKGLRVVRPLLGVRREETEEYCREHGLGPRRDSSNLLRDRLRNRIRHDLLPLLRSYNPKIDEALLRTAEALASESSLAVEHALGVWPEVVAGGEGAFSVDKKRFRALHPAVQRHLLREVVRRLLGDIEDVEWQHIERMRTGFDLRRGKRVVLSRRLTLFVEKDTCRLTAG
jgi:tRNA(Ile)-lysidine synthase